MQAEESRDTGGGQRGDWRGLLTGTAALTVFSLFINQAQNGDACRFVALLGLAAILLLLFLRTERTGEDRLVQLRAPSAYLRHDQHGHEGRCLVQVPGLCRGERDGCLVELRQFSVPADARPDTDAAPPGQPVLRG
ncbi:hypothetical protein OIE77_42360 [Streptomyces sp. NBC_01715]|uniref:hypothetical protein n=1 Tax=Streptomyces sp. NBC_01715 TaxID=2975916 RepID=UPI002E2EB3F9|nr:hypothetical protein [Streptomyces sp. NBC_01715]